MEAVGAASTGALRVLLPKLGRMLADEHKLHKGAKEGIRYIQEELESMQVALQKVSEVPPDQLDPQVKLWARKVRDMSYRIEDTIDSYTVNVNPSVESSTCCFGDIRGMLPRTFKARRDIATEIKRIRKEVADVAKHREMYKVDGVATPEPSDPRLPALYQDAAKLVGIDHSTKQIMKLLFMHVDKGSKSVEKEIIRLVSIVGPSGMGKTTLANVVYQKFIKDDFFHCTAFVSASLKPNIKNILGSILRQVNRSIELNTPINLPKNSDCWEKFIQMLKLLGKDKHYTSTCRPKYVSETKAKGKSILRQESHRNHGDTDNWSKKEIIDKIREILKDKRYLIVIDDIWDEPAWKDLNCVLVPNRLGSKIITTTRNTYVAKLCCSSDNVDGTIHQLGPLSEVESEKLFYYKVFGRDKCPPELKGISRKILGKCKGWPLAIVSIASLLANKTKQTNEHWIGVYNSMGTGLENRHGVKDMRLILSLSYCDMPSQLRDCFLYLSMFQENHLIGRHDLIWRWIAEGFIHNKKDDDIRSLYEVGDEYFNELINRNMIEPAEVDSLGRVQACTVHDVVLEFINSLSVEEGFVTILNGGQPFQFQRDNIHRLSLRNSKEEHCVPKAVKRLPHVRTLGVSSRAAKSMPSLSIFPALRVLDLQHCTSHNIKYVGVLVHLRYLKLSQAYYGSHHIELPRGIGALKYLQILDLKDAKIHGLPATLVQLSELRVLKLSIYNWDKRYEKHLIQCLCNIEKLETLYISVNVSMDFMLTVEWNTAYIRRFTTRFHEQNEHILRPGSVWRELSSFSTLPSCINYSLSSQLSDLSIMVRKLKQQDVEILAQFPTLVTLDLEVVQACEEGKRLVISGYETAFRCLSNLKFASRALGLFFAPGAMQKLHKLYLCFNLARTKDVHDLKNKDLHFGLENLISLKAVEVDIDCRCTWYGELRAVQVVLHNAANSNSNHPAFVVRRYFEREMMSKVLSEHEVSRMWVGDELSGLSRIGPYGGTGELSYGGVTPHHLETITIRSGDSVDSLAFSYSDHNGQQCNAGPWGGSGGGVTTFHLGPSEYLTQVSGTTGSFWGINNVITSLTFITNVTSYGPFGRDDGQNQFVVQARRNNCIVGFFGKGEILLESVYFYHRPL